MAEPNISLLGATYNGVTGVTLPKQGGGTATFPWVEGSETKTQNGTYDVTNLAQLIVNVSGGGGSGLVYESGTYTPTADTEQPTISFTNTHNEPPFFALISDVTNTAQTTNNSEMSFAYFSYYRIFGVTLNAGGTKLYARRQGAYRGTSINISGTGSNDSSDSTSYVSATSFKPSNGSSYYWRSGRTYKWIAVWKPTT